MVPSNHTRIGAWVNGKMQGRNPLVYCTRKTINCHARISHKHRRHGKLGLQLSLLHYIYMWCCDASTFTEHENHQTSTLLTKCVVRLCFFFPFILDVKFVGSTSRGHTGFLIHLPSAVRAFIFFARRIQPFLSLVDREVEFCVLTV